MSNIYCPKGSFLIHYASPYYDPVKAHEYYMEHRQLKGRKSTAGLNDTGKEAARYVKQRLDEEKKGLIKTHKDLTDRNISGIRDAGNAETKRLREGTTADVKAISERANTEKQRLSEETRNEIKRSSDETKGKIANLRDSLKGMSKTRRLLERDKIQKEIDRLREENAATRTKLSEALGIAKEDISSTAKSNSLRRREVGKQDVDAVRTAQKEGIKSQRDTHTEYKKQVTEAYNKKYEDELEKMQNDSSMKRQYKRKRSSS